MSNVAKLKKKAADFELKKDFAKALAVYVEILDNFDEYAGELDVSLFNRVGDLMLRQGNVADAVDYYERAVTRYVDGGFYNNAIALCNKILRQSPGRASVYYILGKISAHKGFTTDAKQNFLEYASRMQSAGKMDEAFRALKEFADLCPGQDDIRLMLADQLTKLNRKPEALEQLQLLWARYDAEGRTPEAAATLQRMRAIDPAFEPRSDVKTQQSRPADLVFLDLDDMPPARGPATGGPAKAPPQAKAPPAAAPRRPAPPKAPPPAAVADLPLLDADEVDEPEPIAEEPEPVPEPIAEELEPIADERRSGAPEIAGFEQTSFAAEEMTPPPAALDLEPTSMADSYESSHHVGDATSSLLDSAFLDETEPAEVAADETSLEEPGAVDVEEFSIQETSSLDLGIGGGDSLGIDGDIVDPFGGGGGSSWQNSDDLGALGGGTPDIFESRGSTVAEPESPFIDFDSSMLEGTTPMGEAPAELRRSTISAAHTVDVLQEGVDADPDNWQLRRELAEAMLESGNREGGIRELEAAMVGAERVNELDLASSIAEEIARLSPDTVRFHQKRVEYAFRTNDKLRLIEAYLALAGALLGAQQAEKARAVYQRVLDLAPDDIRAQAALESIVVEEPPVEEPPPPPRRTAAPRASAKSVAAPAPAASPIRARQPDPEPSGDGDFVNLGDILRGDEGPKSTRMIVDEEEPTGDEDADFADMLKKFKQGIAENVAHEDYQSHYDLGVAFKEMGLLDEAVAEFQKALRAPSNRLPTYEALGQCFIEKEQYSIAATVLARALNEQGHSDDDLVGVLYLLGRAAEALNRNEEALTYYQRVFVVDIEFRDVADRIAELERVSR